VGAAAVVLLARTEDRQRGSRYSSTQIEFRYSTALGLIRLVVVVVDTIFGT
jgi:hypothetical protein